MRVKRLAEALRGLGFEPVLTSGQLAYRTVADDGTPVLHRVARPSDLGDELMQRIRDALPPEDARALRRPEVIAVLRGMASDLPTSSPWEVLPNTGDAETCIEMYRGGDHAGDLYKVNEAGPSAFQVIISTILARRESPRTRAPVILVLSRRDQWPAVMTTLSNLCAGRVHQYGPGHGLPSPDCLLSVYCQPPRDDDSKSRFWTEVRGDPRRPAPVPVILAEWQAWKSWKSWLMSGRASESIPPMWMYQTPVEGDARSLEKGFCAKYWAGAVAIVERGQSIAIRLPKTSLPSESIYAQVDETIRQVLDYLADREAVLSPPGSDAPDPPRAVSSGSSPP